MKKTTSLTKAMVKNTFSKMTTAKKKTNKTKRLFTTLGILALYVYLSGVVFFMSKDLLGIFIALGQENLVINIVFIGASLYAFMIAVLSVPAIFYFSKDLEYLLPLPIKPVEILSAKTITTYLSLLLSLSFILIPFGIAFQVIVMPSMSFIFLYLLAALIIPIIPLAITIALVVLLFTFIPKVNNKDLFTYVTSFLMLGFILFINTKTIGNKDFIQEFISGNPAFNQGINSFLPTVVIITNAVNNSNILLIILALVISLAFIYFIIRLFSPIYFKGAIGIFETSKKRKLKKEKIVNNKKLSPKILTLMKKDLKIILRTPTLAINYLLPIVLLPIFFILPVLGIFKSGEISIEMLKELVKTGQQLIDQIEYEHLITYVIFANFTFTFFMASLSSISSTAISREGERIELYKSMPIKMMLVINAKLLIGIISSSIVPIILVIALSILLQLNISLIVLGLVTIIIASVFSNVLDIILDVYKPKLIWDNENQAVKQNVLTIVPIFLAFLIIGLIVLIFIFFPKSQFLFSILLLIFVIGLTVVLYKVVIEKYGLVYLDKAIEKL